MDKALEEVLESVRIVNDWWLIPHIDEQTKAYLGTHEGRKFVVTNANKSAGTTLNFSCSTYAFFYENGSSMHRHVYEELHAGDGTVYQQSSEKWVKETYESAATIADENVSALFK